MLHRQTLQPGIGIIPHQVLVHLVPYNNIEVARQAFVGAEGLRVAGAQLLPHGGGARQVVADGQAALVEVDGPVALRNGDAVDLDLDGPRRTPRVDPLVRVRRVPVDRVVLLEQAVHGLVVEAQVLRQRALVQEDRRRGLAVRPRPDVVQRVAFVGVLARVGQRGVGGQRAARQVVLWVVGDFPDALGGERGDDVGPIQEDADQARAGLVLVRAVGEEGARDFGEAGVWAVSRGVCG